MRLKPLSFALGAEPLFHLDRTCLRRDCFLGARENSCLPVLRPAFAIVEYSAHEFAGALSLR